MIIHDLQAAVATLQPPVAIDTEFHSEHRYHPKLLLVQIRDAAGQLLVIDPKATPDLSPLGQALSGLPLLLHAPFMDLPLLQRHAGLEPGEVLDPQVLAGFAGFGYPRGLSELVREVLTEELPGGQGLTDWNRRPLTAEQLDYAVADVCFLHRLCEALLALLTPERRELARLATLEQSREALTPTDPDTAWKAIPAARILDPVGRDALRRLAAWRELRARDRDQPPRQVASDAVLVDLCRRRPSSAEQMLKNRKFPKRLAKDLAEPLLGLLAEARPAEDGWPDDHRARVRLAHAEACLQVHATRLELTEGIASRLLLPARLRTDLAVSAISGLATPDLGWRSQMIPELSRLVTGL